MYKNRYLEDKAMRRRSGRGRDRAMDYGYDYPERDSRYSDRPMPDHRGQDYHMGYEQPREHYGYPAPRSKVVGYSRYDYASDYPRYDERDYAEVDKEYHEDLEQWKHKLQKFDKFKLSTSEIINKAKQMGVKFDKYSELEYELVYYMLMSDHPSISNEPHRYLVMAKEWLEDDDIAVTPSEKLCSYYYCIVKGEKK